MILTSLEKEEIDRSSLISTVLHRRDQDSFNSVERIRHTPSDESTGRDFADGV
jgi:hypothetical protein